jgi:hypothetical protein
MRSVAFSLTITLCLAAAAAGLAYVAGRAAAGPEARYEAGVREGERLGRSEARADFAPGTDAYQAIYDKGHSTGMTAGRRAGRRLAARNAKAAGREQAFGEFDGGWTVGHWYLVNIRPGDDGAPYGIGARVPVERDQWYGVCRGLNVCRRSR